MYIRDARHRSCDSNYEIPTFNYVYSAKRVANKTHVCCLRPAFRLLSEAQTFKLILSIVSMALLRMVDPRNDVIYHVSLHALFQQNDRLWRNVIRGSTKRRT